jgi:cyclopropane-fatty-acyl-phospholipid synthase
MSPRLARALIDLVLRRIRAGRLVLVEGERRRSYGKGTPIATVLVRSPRVWRMLLQGSLGLADAYAQGLWDTPDLVALIRLGARNGAGAAAGADGGTSPPTTTSGTSSSSACSTRP